MKENNEITLRIKGSLNDFINNLKEKGYTENEHFILYDIFMVPESLNLEEMSTRDIISKAIIIRKVDDIGKKEIRRDISYKLKKINKKGEILEQKSVRLKVFDCESAENFMKAIGYKTIMNIVEEDYGYEKGDFNLTTKDVKDGDKMIEVETNVNNKNLDTIEKLKEKLIKEDMLLDFSEYFVKKAEVELNKILNRNN